ncbi:MAG: tRNA-intron lyase [Candidatus Thorarchaeota archaeon]|nr:MAG: tRNA-intron lyase [Candidatus Thorarchaeota archaeon]
MYLDEGFFSNRLRSCSIRRDWLPDKDGENPESEETGNPDDEKIAEELTELQEEPAEAIFYDRYGYVSGAEADRISQDGFYGTRLDDGRLQLDPVEMLHLLERKRILTRSLTGEQIEARQIVDELMKGDPDLWTRYLVFRDLRSRGYAVRQGFGGGIGFRVYARGDRPSAATASQLVYVLKEGEPISLQDLDMVTEAASAARKKLVFALVDQNGEVNFYKVSRATLRNRAGEQ